jgi:hypothetical protein
VLYQLADDSINELVVIDSKEAPSYKAWQSNTHQGDTVVNYDLYYFAIQNPEEMLSGEKPIVTEIGPYAYKEYYNKFDIHWSDDGNKVSYNTQKYYLFDSDRTGAGLTEADELLLPYPSVIGFEYLLNMIPDAYQAMLQVGIDAKIKATEIEIEAQIQMIYDALEDQRLPPTQKSKLLAEIRFVNMSVVSYFNVSNYTW